MRGSGRSRVLAVPAGAVLRDLVTALTAVVDRHEALRTRSVEQPDGRRLLHVVPPWAVDVPSRILRVESADTTGTAWRTVLARQRADALARLDPAQAVTFQAVWFDCGPRPGGRLLLVVDGVAADRVPWRALLAELRGAWKTVTAEQWVEPAPVSTSVNDLQAVPARAAGASETGRDLAAATGRLSQVLPAESAGPLLERGPAAFGMDATQLLLVGFGIAVNEWLGYCGAQRRALVVDFGSHGGRPGSGGGADLCLTVTWSADTHPVRLAPGPLTWPQILAADADLAAAVIRMRSQLDGSCPDAADGPEQSAADPGAAAREADGPRISLNRLGRLPDRHALFPGAVDGGTGRAPDRDPDVPLACVFGLDAAVQHRDGGPVLVADWVWAPSLLTEDQVGGLARLWFEVLKAMGACAARSCPAPAPPPAGRRYAGLLRAAAPPADRSGGIPLSFAQLDIVHQPVGPDDPHHNVVTATELTGPLDAAALQRALDDVARRHEVLRSRVVSASAGWMQTIEPDGGWPLRRRELSGHDEASRRTELRRLVRQEAATPFTLPAGPLVRACLIALAPQSHVLVLTTHAVVSDRRSRRRLFGELAESYRAHALGCVPRLPEPGPQLPDYALLQHWQLDVGLRDVRIGHWRRLLADLPVPRFGAPRHQMSRAAHGNCHRFALDEATASALRSLAAREGVQLRTVLLSAFHLMLAAYADTDDIAVSYTLDGRETPEAEEMVGSFATPVVVRPDLSDDPVLCEAVRRMHAASSVAHANQGVPLRCLEEHVPDVARALRLSFGLLGAPDGPLELPGLRAQPLGVPGGEDGGLPDLVAEVKPHNTDVSLVMREAEGRVEGMWWYSPGAVDPQVMGAMLRQWPVLLDALTGQPQMRATTLRRRLRC